LLIRDTSKGSEVLVRWGIGVSANMPRKRFLKVNSKRSRQLLLLLATSLLEDAPNLAKVRKEDPKAGGKGGVPNLGGNPSVTPPEIIPLVWLVRMDVGSQDVAWASCPRASVLMAKIMPRLVRLVCT